MIKLSTQTKISAQGACRPARASRMLVASVHAGKVVKVGINGALSPESPERWFR